MNILLESVGVKPTYCGAHFHMINKDADYHLDGKLYKYKYITFEGGRYIEVAQLPFVPTFTCTKSKVHGSWYVCDQLTPQENEELELSYCHWSGSYYRPYVNDNATQAWVGYFFYRKMKEKYG